ncbi:MAG: hypothetical protein M3Q47_03430, partial [Actinomycetota bacterium]|nr:hypothetical protein [Actinomycetota bacterium]
ALDALPGVLAALGAPLAAGAAALLWADPDTTRLEHVIRTEQVHAVAGLDSVEGVRALAPHD